MSFALLGFQPIGGTEKALNAPQLFSYRTTDASATVEAANYFASAVAYGIRPGDFILVDGSGAGTPHAGFFSVTTATSTPAACTITKLTAIPEA